MTPAYATIRHEHWTITSRTDPRQQATHDFRDTLQALVLAAAGGDVEYARGLLVDLEARYEAAMAIKTRCRTRKARAYLARNNWAREAK